MLKSERYPGFEAVQFEFAPKAARINMRLSDDLLKAIKVKAAEQGVPYQRFIRQALEKAVASKKRSTHSTSLRSATSPPRRGEREKKHPPLP